jgi:hypothetical protein
MVGTLIFIAVIVAVVGGVLGGALWLTRARPGRTKLVLLGAAAGRGEAGLWAERLREAGIKAHIRNVGDLGGLEGSTPYAYEVWVRPKDEARAREVLGL